MSNTSCGKPSSLPLLLFATLKLRYCTLCNTNMTVIGIVWMQEQQILKGGARLQDGQEFSLLLLSTQCSTHYPQDTDSFNAD